MRILLAEDEKALARALVKILERSNYSADAVYNGEDALASLRSGCYDAAVLDVMMPRMDGITVLRTLRAEGNAVPVLLLTALSEVEDKVRGLDSGANDYLAKPFDSRELLARLRCITRTQTAAASLLQLGNLTLDRASYLLSTPTGSLRLGNKEFQLMECLLSGPGQLFSVPQLMEKIWGFDAETEMSVVWVYISNLRKKLSELGATVEIRASRGAGYYLEEKHDPAT